MADWLKMKTEYITTNISYRDLAEKNGVHRTTLAARAQAEGWVELRRQHRDNIVTKALETDADRKAESLRRIQFSADRLLRKLDRAIDELDTLTCKCRDTTKTEDGEQVREYQAIVKGKPATVDRLGARHVAAAMRDIQKIITERPDLDEQVQEAKVAKLHKELEDSQPKQITFRLEGPLEDFSD